MLLILVMLSLTSLNLSKKITDGMELDINCAGKCTVTTAKGDRITLKVTVPDSLKDLFGLKKEDNKIVCGLIEERKKDIEISGDFKDLFKHLSDSITMEIQIPGKKEFFFVEINSGMAETSVELGKYNIKNLWLNIGAGKLDVSFNKKNRISWGAIQVNMGAGTVYLYAPENFRADTIQVFAGASQVTLDFEKRPYIKPTHLVIKQAIASSTVLLPGDIKCLAKKEGILNLNGLDVCSDTLDPELIIHLESALSSVNIIRKK